MNIETGELLFFTGVNRNQPKTDPSKELLTLHLANAQLTKERDTLREVVKTYGDRMAMAFAPLHLQQAIDDAFSEVRP